MADQENIGTGRIQIVVDTQAMQVQLKRAESMVQSLGDEFAKDFNNMTKAQKSATLATLNLAQNVGKTTDQVRLMNAAARGADPRAVKTLADAYARVAQEAEDARNKQLLLNQSLTQPQLLQANQALQQYLQQQAHLRESASVDARAAALRAAESTAPEVSAAAGAASKARILSEAQAFNAALAERNKAYLALQTAMAGSLTTTEGLAAAEAALDRAMATGAITEAEQTVYLERLNVVTGVATASMEANTAATLENAAAAKLSSRSVTELGIVMGELASGNTGRLKYSLAALANQTGFLSKAMGAILSPIGLAATAIGGALAYDIYATYENAKQSTEELQKLSQAIVTSGNVSQQSAGQLKELADQLSRGSGNVEDYVEILSKIGVTANVPAASIGNVASQIEAVAKATGETADQVTTEYQKIFSDPAKQADELFQKLGILTPAEYDLIKSLSETGDTLKAGAQLWSDYYSAIERGPGVIGDLQNKLAAVQKQIDDYQPAYSLESPTLLGASDLAYQKLLDQRKQLNQQIGIEQAFTAPILTSQEREAIAYGETGNRVDQLRDKIKSLQKQQSLALNALTPGSDLYEKERKNYADKIAEQQEQLNNALKKSAGPSLDININPLADLNKSVNGDISGWKQQLDQWSKGVVWLNNLDQATQQLIDTQNEQIQAQVDSVSEGTQEYQRQQRLIEIDKERAQAIRRLNQQYGDGAKNSDTYQKALSDINSKYDTLKNNQIAGFAQIDKAQSSWINGWIHASSDFVDQGRQVASLTSEFFTSSFDDMTDALASFTTTGKLDFKSFVSSVLTDLAKLELRIAESNILSDIVGMFSYGLGAGNIADVGVNSAGQSVAFNPFSQSANGNVFSGGNISDYSGSIVTSPTFFSGTKINAFASGGNLMGEAGPEAILPLSRTSGGKLGVKAVGSSSPSVSVNVVVNQDGTSQVTTQGDAQSFGKDLGNQMAAVAQREISRATKPGGQLWRQGVRS